MLEKKSETRILFTSNDEVRGLPAESATQLIRWTAHLNCRITVRRSNGDRTASFVCEPPSPGGFVRLCGLAARPGETLEITAEGPDAAEAIRKACAALAGEKGTPAVDANLDAALRGWIDVLSWFERVSGRFTKEQRELMEEHLMHANWCDKQWEEGSRVLTSR